MNPVAIAKRRWAKRQAFARTRDWSIALYDALLRFIKSAPFPKRDASVAVHLKGLDQPIFLRLGRSDGFVLEEIFLTRVYLPVASHDFGTVRQIVDLGANVGFSVRLWKQTYPQADIIAVEPDRENFEAIQRNIEVLPEEARQNIHLVRACVASNAGTAYLDRSAEECAFTMTDQPTGDPIEALPLIDILQRCGAAETIDLLKMDIEGAEKGVLAGCADWIGRVRALMIELHPNYSRADLFADLQQAGTVFNVVWEGITAGNPLLFMVNANR